MLKELFDTNITSHFFNSFLCVNADFGVLQNNVQIKFRIRILVTSLAHISGFKVRSRVLF